MGHQFHLEHSHGLVYRDEKALERMAAHRRSGQGDTIKMNIPDNMDAAARPADSAQTSIDDSGVATVVSIIYVTADPTFTGPVGSYSTDSTTATPLLSSITPDTTHFQPLRTTGESSAQTVDAQAFSSTTLATSTSATHGAAVVGASDGPLQATRTPAPTATPSSSGLSGGQQAALAGGVLAAIGILAALLVFCWTKRKAARKGGEEKLDEKHGSFFGTNQPTPSGARFSTTSANGNANAPRLSLRPVTQFLPTIAGARKSVGQNTWDRRPAEVTENPFNDAAILSEKDARPSSAHSGPKNPFEEAENRSNHTANNSVVEFGDAAVSKAVKVGAASAINVTNGRPGPPMSPQANNVHRVQLDFKPSMEDELELRSGQLVRMLHEYDDGWALCIRMDRSQQGVVPRTCLSKLPVKPRNGPPPQGQRRPSPPNGPMSPRPMTPTNGQQRTRTPSDAQGVPARKPVPGQGA